MPRAEDDILADPATTPSMRKRIEADRYGRALMDGLRRHHERIGLDLPMPPRWDDMNAFTRSQYWRAAIYDMLEAMENKPCH